jgi:ISXO2-like transposase domain
MPRGRTTRAAFIPRPRHLSFLNMTWVDRLSAGGNLLDTVRFSCRIGVTHSRGCPSAVVGPLLGTYGSFPARRPEKLLKQRVFSTALRGTEIAGEAEARALYLGRCRAQWVRAVLAEVHGGDQRSAGYGITREVDGTVEADELYHTASQKGQAQHGGKKHLGRRARGRRKQREPSRDHYDKDRPAIIAWVSRQGAVVLQATRDFTVKTVQKAADLAAQAGSRLYTDSGSSYRALKDYVHELVNHTQKEYARGDVHENRAECLFSLLKPYLRVFCGVSKCILPGYVGFFQFLHNFHLPVGPKRENLLHDFLLAHLSRFHDAHLLVKLMKDLCRPPRSSACRAARTPATRRATRRRSTATSSSTALTRTTCTARATLPNGRHDNRPALGVAIGVGVRFRPVCLASAGSRLVSGHARQGRRIMRRPVRAVRACRQDPDVPGAAPERAAAEIVACRFVVPVWPRYREDGLRP